MIYRPYIHEDFDRLYALEEVCFEPPFRFSRRTMRELVQRPQAATWIAEENGQMVGFAMAEWTRPKREASGGNSSSRSRITAYIQTIEVAPEARRRGVGRELLDRIEGSVRDAGAAAIWLHVDAENTAAIQLYEAQGYTCQGRKEKFYPLGRDGLIYMKQLDLASTSGPLPAARRNEEIRGRVSRAS